MTDFHQTLSAAQARIQFSPSAHRYKIQRNGKWKGVPGVTTILKTLDAPALDRWRMRVQREADAKVAYDMYCDGLFRERSLVDAPVTFDAFLLEFMKASPKQYEADRQSEEARDVGKEVHSLIEIHLKAKLGQTVLMPRVSDEAHSLFSSWERWERDAGLVPLAIESLIASWEHGYAGTVDLFALVEGDRTVLDWKSSKKSYVGSNLWPEQSLQNVAYRNAAREIGLGEWKGLVVRLPKDGGDVDPVPVRDEPVKAMRAFLGLLDVLLWQRQREKA